MSDRLSGSGLARARACPAAYALPCARAQSTDGARGTAVHAYLEAIVRGTPPAAALALVTDPDARAICERINTEAVPVGEPEVAIAYDVTTGTARLLEGASGRRYDVTGTEIAGTMDLVVGSRVVDWKTARWDLDVEACVPQLEFYALATARQRGLDTIEWTIGVITDEGAIGWTPVVTLDWEDLARIAARVKATWAGVQDERARRERYGSAYAPDVREGAHCRYCNAWLACPAKRGCVAAVCAVDAAALTPLDAGRALLVVRDAEQLAGRVRAVVGELVDQSGPLPTGDGRVVRRNGRGALCVLKEVE